MRANSLMIAMMVLTSATLFGQTEEKEKKITGGVARKLSEILVGVGDEQESSVELDDLAAAVELALMEVDPDRISNLNEEMSGLKDRESELASQIDALANDEDVPFVDTDIMLSPLDDISEESLKIEKNQLKARQLRIKELEISRQKKQAKTDAINDAKNTTLLSSALLSTLEEMPPLEEVNSMSEKATTEFPARMARALFKTGDYVGALKHFKMVSDEEMEPRDRYEMARSLEETGELDAALPVIQKLLNQTMANDDFWHARGTKLNRLLHTLLGLPLEDEEKGKDA